MIEATRNFVCIRIDSYESEEAQKLVRSYLDGRFENTAFCILSPDGGERLSAGHRGPHQALGADLVGALNQISKKYQAKGGAAEAAVPDFPNFRLGLNVASADQRLLVVVSGTEAELQAARKTLPQLSNDAEILGKFHYDFESNPSTWEKALSGKTAKRGIMIVAPDAFGQKGRVMVRLPLNSKTADLKKALLEANATFAKETPKKVYSEHVSAGRKQGVEWVMPMEYGEDRDGDGKIDFRGPARRQK
ncbi:hypothetical protein V2O64_15400 [Verrucomicrobiaceae bacterium 227]